jgi:hypothetical protein
MKSCNARKLDKTACMAGLLRAGENESMAGPGGGVENCHGVALMHF